MDEIIDELEERISDFCKRDFIQSYSKLKSQLEDVEEELRQTKDELTLVEVERDELREEKERAEFHAREGN